MSQIAHASDVPYAAYIGRVADAERKISEYNSERISQAFLDRKEVSVSTSSPPTYTLKPGESLALMYRFTKLDSNGTKRSQHLDFLNCAKKIRKVDGQVVQFKNMEGFTYSNDHLTSKEDDLHLRGLIGKFEPMVSLDEARNTDAIWQFNAQDIGAFAADAAFSDDANKVAGKILEYMCFHAENDPMPFIILRLDATAVTKGETWDEKNARLKAERDAAAAERINDAQRQRQADKQGEAPTASASATGGSPNSERTERAQAAAASRDAANARAQAASEARNAAARERKAALEAARAARRGDD